MANTNKAATTSDDILNEESDELLKKLIKNVANIKGWQKGTGTFGSGNADTIGVFEVDISKDDKKTIQQLIGYTEKKGEPYKYKNLIEFCQDAEHGSFFKANGLLRKIIKTKFDEIENQDLIKSCEQTAMVDGKKSIAEWVATKLPWKKDESTNGYSICADDIVENLTFTTPKEKKEYINSRINMLSALSESDKSLITTPHATVIKGKAVINGDSKFIAGGDLVAMIDEATKSKKSETPNPENVTGKVVQVNFGKNQVNSK